MRLIDADALKEWIDEYVSVFKKSDNKDIKGYIEHQPTIEPKRGEWIYGEHDVAMCDGYRCNRCDFFVPWDYEHKFIDFINDYHFCPNCGADMRKGADDE